jgi:hypothetical protein
MKKRILLSAVFALLSIVANAQVWDFNDGTVQNWTGTRIDVTANTSDITLTFDESKAIKMTNTADMFDVSSYRYLSVTVLSNSSDVNELSFKVETPEVGETGGNTTINMAIDAKTSEAKTYLVKIPLGDKWSGTSTKISFSLNQSASGNKVGAINIDDISFLTEVTTTEKLVYNFDADQEGWLPSDDFKLEKVIEGIELSSTEDDKKMYMTQLSYHVVADKVNSVKVTLKNTSNAVDLKLLDSNGDLINKTIITTGDDEFLEYNLVLEGKDNWNGTMKDLTVDFGKPETAIGSIIIKKIEFYNDPSLSNSEIAKNDVELKLYPNPVKDVLMVNTPSKILSLDIFDITGQRVITTVSKSVNVEALQKGTYIVKVSQSNGNVSTKKFIKN